MKISDLVLGFPNRARFELRSCDKVPSASGCYVLANVVDDVLYIGQTSDLSRRIEQHLNDSRMTAQTRYGLAHWFYFVHVPAAELRLTEDRLLSRFKFEETRLPPLNRAGP